MKFIAALVFAALIGASYQQDNPDGANLREKFHKLLEECVKETGTDAELVKKAFREGSFPDDKNLKCYFKCMYEKSGKMDANGKIDFSELISRLPPNVDKNKVSQITEKCSQLKNDDRCQLAFDTAKCMREAFEIIHPHSQ